MDEADPTSYLLAPALGPMPATVLATVDPSAVPAMLDVLDVTAEGLKALRQQLATHAKLGIEFECADCGSTFYAPADRGQTYCSNACRQAAYRWRSMIRATRARNGRKA